MNGTLEIGEDRTVYTVTVGDGGPRGQDGNSHFWGYNGGDSTFGHEIVAMGGGGGGFAFQLDDEMNDGTSNASDTFDNPMLSSNEFFKCLNVEIWSLDKMSFTV